MTIEIEDEASKEITRRINKITPPGHPSPIEKSACILVFAAGAKMLQLFSPVVIAAMLEKSEISVVLDRQKN